jgi:hypothetical protein
MQEAERRDGYIKATNRSLKALLSFLTISSNIILPRTSLFQVVCPFRSSDRSTESIPHLAPSVKIRGCT